jgi:leucyl-tRNA synthetase
VAGEATEEQQRVLHVMLKKVAEDIEGLRFNTAISAMMEFLNEASKWEQRPRAILEALVLALSPFAPHLAEELWSKLGHAESLAYVPWPVHNPALLVTDIMEVVVQVNGKLRGRVVVSKQAGPADVLGAAKAEPGVAAHLDGKTIRKEIYVPGKLVNLVVS